MEDLPYKDIIELGPSWLMPVCHPLFYAALVLVSIQNNTIMSQNNFGMGPKSHGDCHLFKAGAECGPDTMVRIHKHCVSAGRRRQSIEYIAHQIVDK